MRFSSPLIVAAVLLFLFLSSACATARTSARPDSPASTDWAPALEGVYARMAAAMSQPGAIYHPTISSVEVSGPYTFTTKTQAWVDLAGSRARGDVEASFGGVEKESSWIIEDRAYIQTLEYDPPFMREATTCRESEDPLVALLLACRAFGERGVTVALEAAEYRGAPAIAVLTQGATDEPGGRTFFTETLFIDPRTYLPIAVEGSGRAEKLDSEGNVTDSQPMGRMVSFAHEYVPAGTVDPSMFNPAVFGYERKNPLAAISKQSPDFTAYWLGEQPALDDLPPLQFGDAYDAAGPNRPALLYRALVTYRDAADEFSPTLLRLEQWRRDEWVEVEGGAWHAWRDAPCVQRVSVETDAGTTATLYTGYGSAAREGACPATSPIQYSAIIVAGETVIRISAPEDSPYNSEEGIRAAIEALERAS